MARSPTPSTTGHVADVAPRAHTCACSPNRRSSALTRRSCCRRFVTSTPQRSHAGRNARCSRSPCSAPSSARAARGGCCTATCRRSLGVARKAERHL
eukprot:5878900-Prymnesium_polylepis.1